MKKILRLTLFSILGLAAISAIYILYIIGHGEYTRYRASSQAESLYSDLAKLKLNQLQLSGFKFSPEFKIIVESYDSICNWWPGDHGASPQNLLAGGNGKIVLHPCIEDSSMPTRNMVSGSNYVYLHYDDPTSYLKFSDPKFNDPKKTEIILYSGDGKVIKTTTIK